MRNRYRSGDPGYKVYTDWFCDLQVRSAILNASSQTVLTYSTFWNKSNIASEILARVGRPDGFYQERNDLKIALIPFCQLRLSEIEKQFKEYQKTLVNTGFERPTEWPKELLAKKMEFTAKFDIYTAEVFKLQKSLKELNEVKEVVDSSHVLEYGLIISSSFKGIGSDYYDERRARAHMDGQFLSLSPTGVLWIDDVRSPYNGMLVSSYRQLARQWMKDRLDHDMAKFKALQASCKEKNIPIPQTPAVSGGKKVNKASLPPFPDWAVKYTPEPKIVDGDSSSTMIRTRINVKPKRTK